jgi:hypothetical protein
MHYTAPVFSAVDFVVCDEGCVLFPLPLLAVLNGFYSERAVLQFTTGPKTITLK